MNMHSLFFDRIVRLLTLPHSIGPGTGNKRMRGPGRRTVQPQGIAAFMAPYQARQGCGYPRDASTYRFARRNTARVLYRQARP